MREKLKESLMGVDKPNKIAHVCCYHGEEIQQRQEKVAAKLGYNLSHGICKKHYKEEMKEVGKTSRKSIFNIFKKAI